MNDLVSVDNVARILSISKQSVYRLINYGELRAYRFGRTFRVHRADLDEYIRNSSTIA